MFVGFLRRYCFFLVLAALPIMAGCGGDGPAEYPVTGKVMLDGHPVEQGEIRFLPAGMQGTPCAGQISNGNFECRATEGQKRVEIYATRESATPAPDGLPNYVSYIPAAYNSQSTLTADIKPKGDNTLTFNLKSQTESP